MSGFEDNEYDNSGSSDDDTLMKSLKSHNKQEIIESFFHGIHPLFNMLHKRFPALKARLSVLELGSGHNRGVLSHAKIEVQHASLVGLSTQQLASKKGFTVQNSSRVHLDHNTSLVSIMQHAFLCRC